jgi:dihydrofolate reductase
MERKVILYIATTLDGYIAREDGGLDWLYATEGEGATYKEILGFGEPFPYENTKNYVFSHSQTGRDQNVEYVSGNDMEDFVSKLKKEEGKHIWLVGGGGLIQAFLNYQLVDEVILAIAPVILGKGIPLFQGEILETRFTLTNTEHFNQTVQLSYSKLKVN